MSEVLPVLAEAIEKGDRMFYLHREVTVATSERDGDSVFLTFEGVDAVHAFAADEPVDILPLRVGGYICLSREMSWGWGADEAQATAAARKAAGGRGARKGDRVIVAIPEGGFDAWVDQLGMVRWRWVVGADISQSVTTVEEPS